MKRLFCLSILLLAGALSWSCSDDDNDGGDGGNGKGGIVLDKGTQTEQVVYANDKSGKNEGIKFTAQGPWKAEVKEVSTKAVAETAQTVDWLALSQYSGDKAGDYTITLTLKQNFMGKSRKAEIRIICGDTVITITVEQKAEKEDGKKLKRVKSVTYRDIFGPGYKEVIDGNESKVTYTYSYDEEGRVAKVVVNSVASEKNTSTYLFDYHIVGEITVDQIEQSGLTGSETNSKYLLTLNEQGNVKRINRIDGSNDVLVEYTTDGRLAKLEEIDSWYQKFGYTDGLLIKFEYWEKGDASSLDEFDAGVLYPNRYPSDGTNIYFNAIVNPIGNDMEEILAQIGLLGKGSDCLSEVSIWDTYEKYTTDLPDYLEPNKVYKYTEKYIKWPEEERLLILKYEFDDDNSVTKFWDEEAYEFCEYSYEVHVGDQWTGSGYAYEIKNKKLKKLSDEKNISEYTVVYE